MQKTILTYGLICGAVLGGFMLATVPFMENVGDWGYVVGYASMLLGFLLVYFGVRSYRDNVAGGRISFGRALLVGGAIAFIGMCCYVATWEIVYHTMMPDFMDKYAARQIDKVRASGASAEVIAKKQQEMDAAVQMYKNPVMNVAFTFLEPLPVAIILTLVSAAVVRRREPLPA